MKPDLKAIRARAAAATKPPWQRHPNPRFYVQFDDANFSGTDEEHEANAQFCAHARTDVPTLLDYAESLETKLAEVRAKALADVKLGLTSQTITPREMAGVRWAVGVVERLASPLERAFGAWAGDASPASTDAGKGRDNE